MMQHLLELRRRLIWLVGFFLLLFSLFFSFSSPVFHYLVSPLLHFLPVDDGLIATHVTTSVFIPLTLAADLALLCSVPVGLFHFWQFAAPGLYRREQQGLGWTIVLSMLLFCIGVLFGFYGVLPLMMQLFIQAVPTGVRFMPEMTSTVDFITRMTLLFGLCFQVPLVCVLLVKMGLADRAMLEKARPYWIVAAFILGMLLTPPDVLSQVMLAVPLCLLYEFGLILVKCLTPRCSDRLTG